MPACAPPSSKGWCRGGVVVGSPVPWAGSNSRGGQVCLRAQQCVVTTMEWVRHGLGIWSGVTTGQVGHNVAGDEGMAVWACQA